MITIDGIVLKERSVGEQDKFIDILTKEHGLLEISVKGAKKSMEKIQVLPSSLHIQGSVFSSEKINSI